LHVGYGSRNEAVNSGSLYRGGASTNFIF